MGVSQNNSYLSNIAIFHWTHGFMGGKSKLEILFFQTSVGRCQLSLKPVFFDFSPKLGGEKKSLRLKIINSLLQASSGRSTKHSIFQKKRWLDSWPKKKIAGDFCRIILHPKKIGCHFGGPLWWSSTHGLVPRNRQLEWPNNGIPKRTPKKTNAAFAKVAEFNMNFSKFNRFRFESGSRIRNIKLLFFFWLRLLKGFSLKNNEVSMFFAPFFGRQTKIQANKKTSAATSSVLFV